MKKAQRTARCFVLQVFEYNPDYTWTAECKQNAFTTAESKGLTLEPNGQVVKSQDYAELGWWKGIFCVYKKQKNKESKHGGPAANFEYVWEKVEPIHPLSDKAFEGLGTQQDKSFSDFGSNRVLPC